MSGSIQSDDYVPGMSGWKLDQKTGELKIGSAKIQLGTLPADPQLITVTAGEWSDSELPSNAIERYKFIGDQVMTIPGEYRDSAEFSTEDFSFDRDGSDYRTTLTYERLETAEEVVARQEKAKVAGTRFTNKDGVLTICRDGTPVICMGNLAKDEPSDPFVVVGDQVFIREASIKEASIPSPWPASWGVKMRRNASGHYVAVGIGLGLDSQFLVSVDKFAIKEPSEFDGVKAKGADALFEVLGGKIRESELGKDLAAEIEKVEKKQGAENRAIAEQIDALSTKLDSLHTLLGQVKGSAVIQAKREVAQALLRDIELDKDGGTLGDYKRRFGACSIPFGGCTGVPLK